MQPVPPHVPPDWDALAHDVLCPLCAYNLRGLADPRCPECGHRFDWADVANPDRQAHPYLFEHHAADDPLSAPKTLAAGLTPRRFWTTLKPVQPSRPVRLALYAFLILIALTTPLALGLLLGLPDFPTQMLLFPDTAPLRWRLAIQLDGVPSILLEPLLRFDLERLVPVMLAAWAALPLAMYLTLLIFQQSMRRFRLRQHHLLRCIVYSADALVWPSLALAVLIAFNSAPWNPGRHAERIAWLLLAGFPALWALLTYRLHSAYKHYLRLDHPAAVIFAVQAIVALLAAIALLAASEW